MTDDQATAALTQANDLYAKGQYSRAVDIYLKLLSEYPPEASAVTYYIAQCYRKMERLPTALFYYESFLAIDPNSPFKDEVRKRCNDIRKLLSLPQQEYDT